MLPISLDGNKSRTASSYCISACLKGSAKFWEHSNSILQCEMKYLWKIQIKQWIMYIIISHFYSNKWKFFINPVWMFFFLDLINKQLDFIDVDRWRFFGLTQFCTSGLLWCTRLSSLFLSSIPTSHSILGSLSPPTSPEGAPALL